VRNAVNGQRRYRAHGLTIASELTLPELCPDSGVGHPDIRIELVACLPETTLQDTDHDFVTVDGGFLMRAEGAAGYHVQGNGLIHVCPVPDADIGLLQLYLIGSTLGLALHQRGVLAMHAAAVLRNDAVTLFVGDSGAGKSTLAARFGKAGFPVLADDVVSIRLDAHGIAVAWPGSTSFKLWKESLAGLDLEPRDLSQVANRLDKYYVRNTRPAEDRPYRVGAIVVLETAENNEHALRPLNRLEALRAVAIHTYRPEYVPLLGRQSEHFAQCVQIARSVPVLRLARPWNLDEIEATLKFLDRECPGSDA